MSKITTRGGAIHGEVEATSVGLLATDFTIFAQFLQSPIAIASASTIVLPDYREYFRVTGTATISAVSTVNVQAGKSYYFMFTGALLLRHNVAPPGGAFKFLLAAGQDITVGGVGNPLILEFKFDSVAVAMVQVGGATSSAIAAGVYGDSNYYVASLTLNQAGEVQAVLLRNFADNKNTSNTGNIVMTQAAPSGPFTNDRLRFDGIEGLIVQDRIQGYKDPVGVTTGGSPNTGLILPRGNSNTIVLANGGSPSVVDAIDYTGWEYGTVVTVRIIANTNTVTIHHLASPPVGNYRALFLTGLADIVLAAGQQRTLSFMLDEQTSAGGGSPVWVEVGEAGASGGGGVASVSAGTGISITGTGSNPIVNNTGVLSVTAGTNVSITGTSANPIVNSTGGGSGFTQLTGDVTAGPGSGSVVATHVNSPSGVTHAGTIITTAIGAPSTPAAGKATQWVDSTSKNFNSKDDAGNINHGIRTRTATASQWIRSIADDGTTAISQPAFTDISGSLASAQFGPLTGDVTTSGYVATLARIPSGTPALGSILFTRIAAPAAPTSGKSVLWADTTTGAIMAKDEFGIVSVQPIPIAAVTSQWLRSMSTAGIFTASQPAFTDISGSITISQLGNGIARSVIGRATGSTGVRADIDAASGSGAALRESGGSIGWGELGTLAYGANTVTYGKIQSVSAGSTLLGRGPSGAGNVQEILVGGQAKYAGTSMTLPRQHSMCFGGQNITGTTLASSSIYLGVGDNSFSTNSLMGQASPIASDGTLLQDWSHNIIASTLSGTGSPIIQIHMVVNGVPVVLLYTGSAAGTGASFDGNSNQPFAAGAVIGVRISVASGSVNAGAISIYVSCRFSE